MEKTPAHDDQTSKFIHVTFTQGDADKLLSLQQEDGVNSLTFLQRFQAIADPSLREVTRSARIRVSPKTWKLAFLSLPDINQTLLFALFRGIKLRRSERRQKKELPLV